MPDGYTPAQRAVIGARLALADEEAKRRAVHGPFTVVEATRFMRGDSQIPIDFDGEALYHPKIAEPIAWCYLFRQYNLC